MDTFPNSEGAGCNPAAKAYWCNSSSIHQIQRMAYRVQSGFEHRATLKGEGSIPSSSAKFKESKIERLCKNTSPPAK